MSKQQITKRHEVGLGLNVSNGGLMLAGGVVALVFYLYYKAKQTVKETAEALNPINPENVVNSALKKTIAAVTGQKYEDVSLAPEVKADTGTFTMTQGQKLDWLNKEIAKVKTQLAAAKTTAEKTAINKKLKELDTRRKAVAAGAV